MTPLLIRKHVRQGLALIFISLWFFHFVSFFPPTSIPRGTLNGSPPAVGSQYTLTRKRRNGEIAHAVKEYFKVTVDDLPDLQELLASNNLTKSTSSSSSSRLHDKAGVLATLRAAGITQLDPTLQQLLPTDRRIQQLYGPAPLVVQGMETCEMYRAQVPPERRYVGVAGLYNTGTTALAIYLQENLILPQSKVNWTQTMEDDKFEHMWEVPWGKHRLLRLKDDITISGGENLRKHHVLPVVIVRDPYSWLQSMCGAPYMARWKHTEQHCPNLFANEIDKKAFPRALKRGKLVPAKLASQSGAYFDSLAHLYRDWYGLYQNSSMPHLVVRFEDLLFRPDLVLEKVRDCVEGQWKNPDKGFVYLVGASKWTHKHIKSQSNRISGIIKYGNGWKRLHNMTEEDIQVVDSVLEGLMRDFHYRQGSI